MKCAETTLYPACPATGSISPNDIGSCASGQCSAEPCKSHETRTSSICWVVQQDLI